MQFVSLTKKSMSAECSFHLATIFTLLEKTSLLLLKDHDKLPKLLRTVGAPGKYILKQDLREREPALASNSDLMNSVVQVWSRGAISFLLD